MNDSSTELASISISKYPLEDGASLLLATFSFSSITGFIKPTDVEELVISSLLRSICQFASAISMFSSAAATYLE